MPIRINFKFSLRFHGALFWIYSRTVLIKVFFNKFNITWEKPKNFINEHILFKLEQILWIMLNSFLYVTLFTLCHLIDSSSVWKLVFVFFHIVEEMSCFQLMLFIGFTNKHNIYKQTGKHIYKLMRCWLLKFMWECMEY